MGVNMAELDQEDGLPLGDVGEWAIEKHARLRKYIDITRAVRKKYTKGTEASDYRGGSSYIDLFCGPGRARVRETGLVIDGSPLVAVKSSVMGKYPFTEIHVADVEQAFCDAAVSRIKAIGGAVYGHVGPADKTATEIVSRLNPDGLHFAFLDPFNLESLSFEIIRQLAKLKRIDLLLHVSVQDLQRNFSRYEAENGSALDTFAPGWRSRIDTRQSTKAVRAAILEYWRTLVQGLGFLKPNGEELVTGSTKQRLYWLFLLSKRQIAQDLWDKIRNISGQKDLF